MTQTDATKRLRQASKDPAFRKILKAEDDGPDAVKDAMQSYVSLRGDAALSSIQEAIRTVGTTRARRIAFGDL